MRKTLLCLLAAVGLCAAGAQAQAWHTELGLQGGLVRLKPAGTGLHDQTDLFFAPGFDLGPALPTPSALFVIVPVSNKVALEPSFSAEILAAGTTASLFQAGLRLDYALTNNLYGSAGGLLGRFSGVGFDPGLQLAAGYHFHLMGPVQARVEANVQTWKGKTPTIRPSDTYALLFGIMARL